MANKHKCYKCNKELEEKDVFWHPVVESPQDAENPPEVPFCESCYQEVAEPNY